MKVFGLLSGGKDGCFGLLKCVQHGHEVVAVGNLHPPPNSDSEEMDSFFYQTVGTTVVASIAQCIGVPLMTREIKGTAVVQDLDYTNTTDGDEVEDLYWLLVDAKRRWPDLEAVSNGALLSTYQRHRVENVCARLGLISLAYLWQYDQAELVREMGDHGLEAIIAKVASMGLKPSMLGKRLQSLFPQFEKLNEQFGFHVAGEGGEYESLALACPGLFRDGYRVVIDESKVVMHEDAMYAPVAYLQVLKHHAELNGERQEPWAGDNVIASTSTAVSENAGNELGVTTSNDTDAAGTDVATDIQDVGVSINATPTDTADDEKAKDSNKSAPLVSEITKLDLQDQIATGGHSDSGCKVFKKSNASDEIYITCSLPQDSPVNVGIAVMTILNRVQNELEQLNSSMADIVFVHLLIRDMDTFTQANAAYCRFFKNAPPSRACVQVPLLVNNPVSIRVFAVRGSSTAGPAVRKVLHVRSFSEWAPVCIGPYSQCNSVNGLSYCAGQIALIPATMKMLNATCFSEHVRLCLRHCDRILLCSGSSLKRVALCTVYISPLYSIKNCTEMVCTQLEQNYNVLNRSGGFAFVVVQVPRLPRDAPVEVQVVARSDIGSQPVGGIQDDDSDDEETVVKDMVKRPNSGFKVKGKTSKEIIDACRLQKEVFELTIYYVPAGKEVDLELKLIEESSRETGFAFSSVPVADVEEGVTFVGAGLAMSWSIE